MKGDEGGGEVMRDGEGEEKVKLKDIIKICPVL